MSRRINRTLRCAAYLVIATGVIIITAHRADGRQCEEWTEVATTGPSARYSPAMVYDSVRRKTVLFGGGNGGRQGDTYEWDGDKWRQVATTGPTGRYYHAMAYDTGRRVSV